jgi:hypothetical protein
VAGAIALHVTVRITYEAPAERVIANALAP